ncbi:MAG: 50S ribosomal protein L32, partial [bacterium]
MANPKRKISKSRRDKRRTHWKLSAPAISECPQCHQPKLPHRICPHCGYYAGRMVY